MRSLARITSYTFAISGSLAAGTALKSGQQAKVIMKLARISPARGLGTDRIGLTSVLDPRLNRANYQKERFSFPSFFLLFPLSLSLSLFPLSREGVDSLLRENAFYVIAGDFGSEEFPLHRVNWSFFFSLFRWIGEYAFSEREREREREREKILDVK